jgi:hypothetical protein
LSGQGARSILRKVATLLHGEAIGMPYQTHCPSCKRLLDVPDGCEETPLVCPGCQGEVVHPVRQSAAIQAAPVAVTEKKPPAELPPREPLASSGVGACRVCGEFLEKGWIACPYCGNPRAGSRSPENSAPAPATIVLAIVGLLGVLAVIVGLVLDRSPVGSKFAVGGWPPGWPCSSWSWPPPSRSGPRKLPRWAG